MALDPGSASPLHVQLTEQLRQLILSGRLAPGTRLPSSRQLAEELGVSRSTVVAAFEQLASEGYSEGRHGSGVYVASQLPESQLLVRVAKPLIPKSAGATPAGPDPVRPFQVAAPELALFPHEEWARLAWRIWRNPSTALLGQPDPKGWLPLRRAIGEHLSVARGLDADPNHIVITSGVAEAISVVAAALFSPGDRIAVEEPGYPLLRRALTISGLDPLPVAVDESGFDPARIGRRVAAVAVTPSRHYPLGMTMPLPRRLQLLAWAEAGGYVLEDDYDSEFRYRGRPLPALMSLDRAGRTLYIGSFSKVISPSIRLGYIVVPPPLEPLIAQALKEQGPKASLMPQPVLAEFMSSGIFAAHVRRMRRLYAKRQSFLLAAAERHLSGLVRIAPEPAGMHVIADLLDPSLTDIVASESAAAAGLVAPALSSFATTPQRRQGLVLGYAAFPEPELERAVRLLAQALGKAGGRKLPLRGAAASVKGGS
jgi:GntR family transcriptional regulator / MocR family aminotransferase